MYFFVNSLKQSLRLSLVIGHHFQHSEPVSWLVVYGLHFRHCCLTANKTCAKSCCYSWLYHVCCFCTRDDLCLLKLRNMSLCP